MKQNHVRLILASGLALCLLMVMFYVQTTTVPLGEKLKPFDQYGGDFTLQSSQGPVSLKDHRGDVVVLYFGYLSCAEVCPASMSVMSNALKRVERETGLAVKGLFISVDPKRDDISKMDEFTQYFHHNITGLTGSRAEIEAVAKQYGVYFDEQDMDDSFLEYSVDHVSRFYMIDRAGKLVTAMSHSTTPRELAAKVMQIL